MSSTFLLYLHYTLLSFLFKSFWSGVWGETFFKKFLPIELTLMYVQWKFLWKTFYRTYSISKFKSSDRPFCSLVLRLRFRENKNPTRLCRICFGMGEGGFEPPKAVPADLQSVPFGHSGIPPGAGEGSRTPNLLITNQLLCHWATPAFNFDTASLRRLIL